MSGQKRIVSQLAEFLPRLWGPGITETLGVPQPHAMPIRALDQRRGRPLPKLQSVASDASSAKGAFVKAALGQMTSVPV